MKKLLLFLICFVILSQAAVTVYADFRFSPSRESVEPVIQVTPDSGEYWGITHDDDDFKLPIGWLVLSNIEHRSWPDRSTLSSTAIATLEKADQKMERVYKQFKEAKSLFDVFGTDRLSPDTTYVITKFFDLTAVDEGIAEVEKAFAANGKLEVPFKMEMPKDKEYYFATLCEEEWVILEEEQIREDDKGVVSIFFYDLCPIVLIEAAEDTTNVVQSPQTSNGISSLNVMAIVFGGAAVICLLLAMRNKREAEQKN